MKPPETPADGTGDLYKLAGIPGRVTTIWGISLERSRLCQAMSDLRGADWAYQPPPA
jgi:hypothetical protein